MRAPRGGRPGARRRYARAPPESHEREGTAGDNQVALLFQGHRVIRAEAEQYRGMAAPRPVGPGPGSARARADASPADPAHKMRRGETSPPALWRPGRNRSRRPRKPSASPTRAPPHAPGGRARSYRPCARQKARISMGSNLHPARAGRPSTVRLIAGKAGVTIADSHERTSAASAISAARCRAGWNRFS